jgi:hypothetical protein
MKGTVECAFVARELIVRTARHLVVLTLPLVCWLAGQECPAQMLLAWAVQRGMALLTTAKGAAQAKETAPVRFSSSGLAAARARVVTRKSVNQNHTKVSPIPSSDCLGSALLF